MSFGTLFQNGLGWLFDCTDHLLARLRRSASALFAAITEGYYEYSVPGFVIACSPNNASMPVAS
jgi:hypothetical protein